MVAAASRLAEAYPDATVRGFALVKTVSNPADFEGLETPCVGTVRLYPSGKTHREP